MDELYEELARIASPVFDYQAIYALVIVLFLERLSPLVPLVSLFTY